METHKQKQDDIIGSGLFGIVKRETIIQKDKTYRVAKKILNLKKINDKINKQISEEIKKTKERISLISKIVKENRGICKITQNRKEKYIMMILLILMVNWHLIWNYAIII